MSGRSSTTAHIIYIRSVLLLFVFFEAFCFAGLHSACFVRVNKVTFLEGKDKDVRPEPEYDGYEEKDPFQDFSDDIEITDDDLPF